MNKRKEEKIIEYYKKYYAEKKLNKIIQHDDNNDNDNNDNDNDKNYKSL